MWIILGVVALAVIVMFMIFNAKQKDIDAARNELSQHYPTDELYVTNGGKNAIGFNFADQTIVLRAAGTDKVYPFSAVSGVEVIQNGVSITKTNRGSQLVGAAVGGLAFGGVGALIGGLSGSQTTHHQTTNVAIKVTVDDNYHPVYTVPFVDMGAAGVNPNNPRAQPAQEALARVHAHLINGMRRVQQTQAATLPPGAAAGSLGKLFDMRQAGALSEEEFQQQKALILAQGTAAAALPVPEEQRGRRYRVILVHPGPNRWKFGKKVVEVVPEIAQLDIAKLYRSLPAPILWDVGETRARSVQEALRETGATIEIE